MRIFDPWYGVVRVKTDVLLRSIFMEIFQKKISILQRSLERRHKYPKPLIPGCKRSSIMKLGIGLASPSIDHSSLS